MPQSKPWERDWSQPAAAPNGMPSGSVMIAPAAPDAQYKGPNAAAELTNRNLDAESKRLDNIKKKQELDDAASARQALSMQPDSKVHGDDYIKTLPADAQGIVRSLLQGNLPVGTRGITSKELLPYLKMAINADPSFSANTFSARQTATKQLADMKATGGYLTSLTANIDHSKEEESAINRLGNPGGIYGRLGGAALNDWLFNKNGPAGAQFDQANRVYAGEQVKSITGNVGTAGGGSALADRQEAEQAIGRSMPIDAQRAALRTGAIQNYQKFRDANAGYRRTMGADIPDAMSPEQAKQLLHLMRLQDDGTEGDIPEGTDPGFVALATGSNVTTGNGGSSGAVPGVGGSTPPGGPTSGGGSPLIQAQQGGSYGEGTVPTIDGDAKTVNNSLVRKGFGLVNSLFASGAPDADIRAKAKQYGLNVEDNIAFRKNNPGFKGPFPSTPGMFDTQVPLTPAEGAINKVFGSAGGTFFGNATNQLAAGLPRVAAISASSDPEKTRTIYDALSQAHPGAAVAGDLVGSSLGAVAPELGASKLIKAAGLAEKPLAGFAARRLGDSVFGGVTGATGAPQGQTGSSAIKGALAAALGGAAGEGVGQYVVAPALGGPARSIARNMGADIPVKPTPPEYALSKAAGRSDLPDIQNQLSEAQSLGLPMTLADTAPEFRALGGAAVRRSPAASGVAENVFLPRSRGQIDRFQSAIRSNLGPVDNIPQLSADLTAQAKTAAGPLYDQAYAAPGASSVKLDDIINRPLSMKPALSRAKLIAEEEGRDPTSLGFDLTDQGEVTLNRVPSFHTLDYVKRGLDDTLEPYRDTLTGKLQLNEATRAINNTKNDLLGRIDKVNPAYAQARQAYAGPTSARDALALGQDASSLTPDEFSFQMGSKSPEQQAQMQLGYRGAMSNAANRARYSSNPYDSVLGTPDAEAKLATAFPDNPNVPRLLRQRDVERGMQNTSNDILGNSKTAQRGIADEAFAGEDLPQAAMDVGINLATGQVPIGAMLKAGTGQYMRDALKMGIGKKAVAKADALAPVLFNPDPAASSAELADILSRVQGYGRANKRIRGLFGAPVGVLGAGIGAGEFGS